MNMVTKSGDGCQTGPIHAPDAIQGWGALLVADEASLQIRHASANLHSWSPLPAAEALGRSLPDVLGERVVARLLPGNRAAPGQAGHIKLPRRAGLPPLAATALRDQGSILVEMEPARWPPCSIGRAERRPPQQWLVESLRGARDFQSLFTLATAALRQVTGFDRVLLYRFDSDNHGEVLADDHAPGMDSLLGLHFPKEDIPPQARQIFSVVTLRLICDSQSAPVPLLRLDPASLSPDLSRAALRAPAPCHSAYLGNMGSRATATIALTVDGRLWGVLACHHRKPGYLPPDRRALCAVIGHVTSLMVAILRDVEGRKASASNRALLAGMAARLAHERDDPARLAEGLAAESDAVLRLCDAEAAIIRLGGRTLGCGAAPAGAAADTMLDAIIAAAAADGTTDTLFATDHLACHIDPAILGAMHAENPVPAAGALLLKLNEKRGDAIVWLRPEQSLTVRWGSQPDTPLFADIAGDRLVPRGSYMVWQQEVRDRSRLWRTRNLEAAAGLRREIDKLLVGYAEKMRVAREAAERATQAKSEFLATMSHEIRSPMSGLLGVLELLRGTKLDGEQTRMASMIHSSASMLLAVLNDILDFSKIEAGALSIVPEPVSLRALIASLVQPISLSAGPATRLAVEIEPALPDCIVTDPLRLQQILGNLLSNAVKFTAAGTITLKVTAAGAEADPILRFQLRDTGIGMSADVVARLFAPFMQADGSTTRKFGGTGLGLCISQQLTRLLGGTLSAASRLGEGSEFTLDLPLRLGVLAAPRSEVTAPGPQHLPLGDKRVLVVDDDATIRWLSQRQLEKLGIPADIAKDGEEGLQKLRSGAYHLVLTDCHMPRMDGVTLTRAIRHDPDPALRGVPVIGLTADVTETQRSLCHQAGMNELAIKPLTVDRLLQLLLRHLQAGFAGGQEDVAESHVRDMSFDDQIYHAIFPPGDPQGQAWLTEWLASAWRDLCGVQALLTARVDWAELRQVAHRLAGSSFSVGATRLGTAARLLEAVCDTGQQAVLHRHVARIDQEYQDAKAEILAFLKQAG
jgi:light-regulated signal transduction histidine kinase (bacteriophytochrome)/CheY-like chemotaxis protein